MALSILPGINEDAAAQGDVEEAKSRADDHRGHGVEHEELETIQLRIVGQRPEERRQFKADKQQADSREGPPPGIPPDQDPSLNARRLQGSRNHRVIDVVSQGTLVGTISKPPMLPSTRVADELVRSERCGPLALPTAVFGLGAAGGVSSHLRCRCRSRAAGAQASLHAEFDFGFRRTSPQLGSGPTQRPTNGHMKPALSALAATIALALGGCGLEAARPTILVQNNSDQVIVLQAKVDGRVVPKATAMPHTKERSMNSPLEGRCVNNWEIVDENGRLLKKVDQLCAYDTVVYP